ncbi:MAG: HAD family hydrolase [Pirellulaceae bacterium]|jgi:D-glycero-D-manno-heptose 1,7-bisphosphate phosphatase|nr:HAD family hydrolase [Pirellulaceae bacterium]
MPSRFVLLDRDGTLIVKRPYLCDPRAVELLPRAAEGLRAMRRLGWGLIVATNQSGIGRGFFTWEQAAAVHARLRELLNAEGLFLDDIFLCPHTPEEQCRCRKPAPGMVYDAAAAWGFDPRASIVIGDAACDVRLGRAVGAFTIRTVQTASAVAHGLEDAVADETVRDLVEAAAVVERHMRCVEQSSSGR